MRTGILGSLDEASADEGTIASSQGNARLTPAPRSSVLREIVTASSVAPSDWAAYLPDSETERSIRSLRSAFARYSHCLSIAPRWCRPYRNPSVSIHAPAHI